MQDVKATAIKKLLVNFSLAAAVIGGIGLLIYPHIAFWLAGSNQAKVVQGYQEEIEKLDQDVIRTELEKAKSYNAKLTGTALEDPFIAGTGKVVSSDYQSILHITEEMGAIKIPRIGVELPIYHGTSDETLLKGSGHLEGTSLPVGGEGTHTVITAHTGLNTAKMFTDLIELETGDEFYLLVLDDIYAYQVEQIKVAEPTDLDELRLVPGEDYATLLTCTPYGINSHRLLVRGKRVPYSEEEARIQEEKREMNKETWLLFVSICALAALGITMLAAGKISRMRRKKRF